MKIIYKDKDIIVIEKQAGLTVHPINQEQKDTLVNELLAYYPKIKNVGDDILRPGIVHRLDKDTSGLIIVAKNNKSFEYLKNLFAAGAKSSGEPKKTRRIIKKYIALVHGKVKDKKGTITKSISLSKKDYKKRSALLDNKSKKAWTEYKVLETFFYKKKEYTLLEVSPKTGRTHQIRIHLKSIGHPIVGDKQYKFKRQITPKKSIRQFLHAEYLKFKTPDGKIMEFKSELPEDLKEVLKEIKKNE